MCTEPVGTKIPSSSKPHEEGRSDMYGHARPVERTIRLWIAQQEHNRRRQEQRARRMGLGSGDKTRRGIAATNVSS
jgi:hypothetical protein